MSFTDPETAFPMQRAINVVESKRNCSVGEVGNAPWCCGGFVSSNESSVVCEESGNRSRGFFPSILVSSQRDIKKFLLNMSC